MSDQQDKYNQDYQDFYNRFQRAAMNVPVGDKEAIQEVQRAFAFESPEFYIAVEKQSLDSKVYHECYNARDKAAKGETLSDVDQAFLKMAEKYNLPANSQDRLGSEMHFDLRDYPDMYRREFELGASELVHELVPTYPKISADRVLQVTDMVEGRIPPETTSEKYNFYLSEMTGTQWEFKAANENGVNVDNLRVPYTPEIEEKLKEGNVNYKFAKRGDERLIFVDTNQPLVHPVQQQNDQQQNDQQQNDQQQNDQQQNDEQTPPHANHFQPDFLDYAKRYDAEMAAQGAVKEDVAKKFANESAEFFVVAQKREYDEALLKSLQETYYGTPGNPGRKDQIEGKDIASLPPADQMLANMVSKYGLTSDVGIRTNDLPVDLRDYPDQVREGYVAQMNALLSNYVPNHQPLSEQDLIAAADRAEGRPTPTMEPENTIENNSQEVDLLKEAEQMKDWLNYYRREGIAEHTDKEHPYQSPYANIVKVVKMGGKEDSPVHMQLDTGSTLVNTKASLHLAHAKGGPTLEECMTMVRMGQRKGWTTAKLTGSEEFKSQMYLACRALGMPVKDYEPSQELQAKAEEMMANMPRPSYAEKAADLDARTQGGTYTPPKGREPEPQQDEQQQDAPDKAKLQAGFDAVDKVMGEAMDHIAADEKAKLGDALKKAGNDQRKAWRNELKGVEAKEAKGEALTPQEMDLKAKAAKYQIMTDPKKEPKKTPAIPAKDMDPGIKKALKGEERRIKADTMLTAAVAQELCAKTKDSVVNGSLDISAPIPVADLMTQTEKVVAEKKANMPKGMAALLREAGNTAASAKNIFAQAAVNFQQKTNEAPVQNQTHQMSDAAKKMTARLATVAKNQGR